MSSNGILLTFCDDLGDLRLQLAQRAAAPSACAPCRRCRSSAVRAGAGDEVERDVELAGEQVAGAQLRAQAAGDELLQDDGVVAGAVGDRAAAPSRTGPSRSG